MPQLDPKAIIEATRKVVGAEGVIQLHPPLLNGFDRIAVEECLTLEPVGYSYVSGLEKSLQIITGAAHVLATVNGTAALHLALKCAGVRSGDEVLMPALTFVASANAVTYCGAIPHFVDSSPENFGIQAHKLEVHIRDAFRRDGPNLVSRRSGRRLGAILMIDLLGLPGDGARLAALASSIGVPLVEDAAQALGTTDQAVACGTFGKAGVFSFNANKIVTTGGGGALLTNDGALAHHARHLATTAKVKHPWSFEHDAVAYNYRMANMNAAIGVTQLARLDETIATKRLIFRRYQDAFRGMPGCSIFDIDRIDCRWNAWLTPLLLDPETADRKAEVLNALHADGIMARAAFTPLHRLQMFAQSPRDNLAVAEHLASRLICLPSGPGLPRS